MAEKARNTGPDRPTTRATTGQTDRTPPGFVPAGDTSAADAAQEERDRKLQDQVDASTLEAAPEDQKGPTGGSFHNPATVGSGTILPDGTYGAPLPDPNVARLAKAHEESSDNQ